MPLRIPNSSVPANAASADQNSGWRGTIPAGRPFERCAARWKRSNRRNAGTSMNESTAAMTTAASTGYGRLVNSGVRTRSVARMASFVVTPAITVRPPAPSDRAVCAKLALAG